MTGFESKREAAADKLQEPEREALKLALEALESMQNAIYNIEGEHVIGLSYAIEQADVTEQAITVIRKALAQPAQEPVAWMVYTQDGKSVYVTDNPTDIQEGQRALPLYTTPPQPVQEPVGWADLQKKAQQIVESKFLWKRFIDGTPLANDIACWMADFARQYTTPPQREWVGLTDEEIASIPLNEHTLQTAERLLKEKNT